MQAIMSDGIHQGDKVEAVRTAYGTSMRYRTPIGVSRDGRPMYSPMFNDGEEYDPCDVDICNGMMVGGHYSYVSTMFHPYYMGCYGPGYDSDYAQQCSRNPRICGDIATVNEKTACMGFDCWVEDLFGGEHGFFKILFKFFDYMETKRGPPSEDY